MAKDIFEANYEHAKNDLILFANHISTKYDIPSQIMNLLFYEIALEARNQALAMIVGACDIEVPNVNNANDGEEKPIKFDKKEDFNNKVNVMNGVVNE